MSQKSSTSLTEEYKIFFRAAKINFKISPSLTFITIGNAFFEGIRPLTAAFFSSLIINNILKHESFWVIAVNSLYTIIVQLFLNLIVRYTANRMNIKKSIWKHMCTSYLNDFSIRMDYEYFENPKVKELFTRINTAINNGEGLAEINALIQRFANSVTKIIMSFSALSVVLLTSPKEKQEGVYAFVNSPITVIIFILLLLFKTYSQGKINAVMSNKIYKLWGDAAKPTALFDRFYSLAVDYKNGMDLRIFREEEIIKNKTRNFILNPFGTEKITKGWILNAVYQHLIDTIFILFQYFIVVLKAISGAFGIGNLVLYTQILSSFSNGILDFTGLFVEIQSNNRRICDFFSFIDLPNNMRSGERHIDSHNLKVEFKNVSFKYPFEEKYALKNINVKFEIGEYINIVGINGSGKTTFVKLLCRLYDPTEGEILLNGINIKEYVYEEYKALFSVVFQDFKLFAFQLKQNISVSEQYEEGWAIECLEKIGLTNFLKSAPQGMDTFLYKNFVPDGIEISGGEAQKIAIARALYKDSPFIILDEPTAALDPIAEYDIYTNMQKIITGKTAICISHRLSSCRTCDRIVVFDNGEIIQTGTHDELSRVEGKYKLLWNAQADYYKVKL